MGSPSPALMAETDPEDVRPISVSLEIKRFQEEINKVQAENCQFYQWKLRRVASRPSVAPSLTPRGISSARSQESILAPPPGRPPKKNNKKVSYCDAVTVFGSSESLVHCVGVKNGSDSEINNNNENEINHYQNDDPCNEEELILPSV